MFRCNDCGHEFIDPKIKHENMGEFWGARADEAYGVCPECESEDFDELDRCPVSNEYKKATEDYNEYVVQWGKEMICDTITSIQSEWGCDYETAKNFMLYMVEKCFDF